MVDSAGWWQDAVTRLPDCLSKALPRILLLSRLRSFDGFADLHGLAGFTRILLGASSALGSVHR
jgi:hypothetical protein